MLVQRPRQGRRFEHDDLVFAGNFADLGSSFVGAFGDHFRCAAHAVVVFQRHRVVGRIGDDQEMIQESKESDGNPQIKAKIRQLQREMARRRMPSLYFSATA